VRRAVALDANDAEARTPKTADPVADFLDRLLALPRALTNKMNLPPGKEPTSTHWLAAMSHIKPWFDELSRNSVQRLLPLWQNSLPKVTP
jgi:hypothetical protein